SRTRGVSQAVRRAQDARTHPAHAENGEDAQELMALLASSALSRPMRIVDCGSGPPLVLIPGLQGRWEYLRGTVDALSQSFRVLTFPLSGERGSGLSFERARGLDNYVAQVNAVLDDRGIDRAIICGVS